MTLYRSIPLYHRTDARNKSADGETQGQGKNNYRENNT